MPLAQVHVATERPSRYLVQLCRHISQMGRQSGHRPPSLHGGGKHIPPEVLHVEWSDTHGAVRLNWGQLTVQTAADGLTLRVEADNDEDLRRIQDLLAGRLEKIGRRDHLTVSWQQSEEPFDQADETAAAPPELPARAVPQRRNRRGALLAAVGLLVVVALHLGLGGAVLAAPQWAGWTLGAVVAVVVAKVVVVGGVIAIRRRKAIEFGRTESTRERSAQQI